MAAAQGIVGDALYRSTSDPLDDFDSDDDRTAGESPVPAAAPEWRIAPPEVKWNHGPLSRDKATDLLMQQPVGSFLLRESLRSAEVSISFRVHAGVKHFKVIRHEYGDYFIGDNSFSTLSELVENYCNECLCDDLLLQFPVPPAVPYTKQQSTNDRDDVVAITSFERSGPNELSCTQGERLTVINADDKHWLYVSKASGSVFGFVPKANVKSIGTKTAQIEAEVQSQLPSSFHRSRWIHGNVDRQGAEALLQKNGKPGAFLIRASGETGNYSLSFRGPRRIQHFRVRCQGPNDYECGGRAFSCLEALVLRYYTEPLMDEMTLKYPIASPKAPAQGHDVDGDIYSEVQNIGMPAKPARRQVSPSAPQPSAAAAVVASSSSKTPPKPIPTYQRIDTLPHLQTSAQPSPLRAGWIVKKAKRGKRWKPHFFVLVVDKRRLEYFETSDAFKPKGIVDLESAAIYPLDVSYFGRPNCFQILVQSATIYLCCDTEMETCEWLEALAPHAATVGYGIITPDVTRVSRLRGAQVAIMEAKKYGSKHTSLYCIVGLGDVKVARTPVKPSKKESAFWAEEFLLDNLSKTVDTITVTLYSRGKVRDRNVGEVRITLADLSPNAAVDKWWPLAIDGAKGATIRIKITHVSTPVLPLSEYAALSKLLTDDSLAHVLALADAAKNQLAEVGKHVVRLWVATGHILRLTHTLVSRDIASEKTSATLFRGNTLATKALDQFMKETALPFLHSAIGDPVRELFEDKASCELDPTRKGRPENAEVLLGHVKRILEGVAAKAEQCPPSLRAVLQSVRELASERYVKDPLVQYTSVSAFIFLRLICPAVLNPKLFNMLPDFPSETTARNLTLVAKVIQNAANMSEFGEKEPYMIICNDYLRAHSSDMQALILRLSSVSSSHATTAEKAASSAPDAPGAAQHALANITQLMTSCRKPLEKLKTQASKALLTTLKTIESRS
eukprot:m.13795 g.13795  ORF g.13795 m.13795 type:complete len:958 (+) comp3087_c0_seq1:336-3209(+)